jgi:transposase-like protein
MERIKGEKKRQTMNYGAMEKCKAVLSVWTERRRPAEICRELSIPWMVLSHWQKRAMEGMLQALETRVSLDRGPALSPRLQAMLEKKRLRLLTSTVLGRLEKPLSKAQESRKTETASLKDEKPLCPALRKSEKVSGEKS